LDPKVDTNAKVINAFLKILINEMGAELSQDMHKNDFMNQAMMVYTKRKCEVDTLARTFENLNKIDSRSKLNKSLKLSPGFKKYSKRIKQSKQYISGYSKSKNISSRFKMSGISNMNYNIIPPGISNVNKSINSTLTKQVNSQSDSQYLSRPKKSRNTKLKEHKHSSRGSQNKSLKRYKLGCYFTHNSSEIKKSKSICQDDYKKYKYENKTPHQYYSKLYLFINM